MHHSTQCRWDTGCSEKLVFYWTRSAHLGCCKAYRTHNLFLSFVTLDRVVPFGWTISLRCLTSLMSLQPSASDSLLSLDGCSFIVTLLDALVTSDVAEKADSAPLGHVLRPQSALQVGVASLKRATSVRRHEWSIRSCPGHRRVQRDCLFSLRL